MILWLFNNNSELTMSDGFTNALSNKQIEFNLINNLKFFDISDEEFANIISLNQKEYRNKLFLTFFNYRYQANSLYTYSEIDNYLEDQSNIIENISPFRVQSQIIPEDEKIRFMQLFLNHKIDENFISDYAIINNSRLNVKLKINNSDYKKVLSLNEYDIYKK